MKTSRGKGVRPRVKAGQQVVKPGAPVPRCERTLVMAKRDGSPEVFERVGLERTDLTEREVAAIEGVSVRTLQDWRRLGVGPRFRKLGTAKRALVRYPIAWYRQWREETASTGPVLGRVG